MATLNEVIDAKQAGWLEDISGTDAQMTTDMVARLLTYQTQLRIGVRRELKAQKVFVSFYNDSNRQK